VRVGRAAAGSARAHGFTADRAAGGSIADMAVGRAAAGGSIADKMSGCWPPGALSAEGAASLARRGHSELFNEGAQPRGERSKCPNDTADTRRAWSGDRGGPMLEWSASGQRASRASEVRLRARRRVLVARGPSARSRATERHGAATCAHQGAPSRRRARRRGVQSGRVAPRCVPAVVRTSTPAASPCRPSGRCGLMSRGPGRAAAFPDLTLV
jgi:hypothetical protein